MGFFFAAVHAAAALVPRAGVRMEAREALGGYTPADILTAPKHAPLTLHLRSRGRHASLRKAPGESVEHLLLKGLLWAAFTSSHPEAQCEADLGLRYRPDVVALDAGGLPCWWGECGSVAASKLSDLAQAYPAARFSVAKWGRSDLRGYAAVLRSQLVLRRSSAAQFDLVSFPADSAERFLRDDGEVVLSLDDLDVVPLGEGARGKGRRRRR